MPASTVEIWVSSGSFREPFYDFYTDATGVIQIIDLILDPSKSYIFHRLKEASTHPFYLKSDPNKKDAKPDYHLSGEGNTSLGITGNQSFTLSFSEPNQAPAFLTTYCTAHPSMKSTWSISQTPDPAASPESTTKQELESYEPPNTQKNINGSKKDDVLKGTNKADFIIGKKGDDNLIGNKGNDILQGNQGKDILKGGKGDDYLDGSKGYDTLIGGKGADVFQISKGTDLVEDFRIKQGDRIAIGKKGKYMIVDDIDGVLVMVTAKKQLFLDGVDYDDAIAVGGEIFVQIV